MQACQTNDRPEFQIARASGANDRCKQPSMQDQLHMVAPSPARFSYHKPLNDNLLCAICKSAFQEPVETPCGHVFCAACLAEWLAQEQVYVIFNSTARFTNQRCPMDKLPVKIDDVRPVNRALTSLMDTLDVQCAHCQVMTARANIDRHYRLECQSSRAIESRKKSMVLSLPQGIG